MNTLLISPWSPQHFSGFEMPENHTIYFLGRKNNEFFIKRDHRSAYASIHFT
jgi:hypothetical protein